MLGGLLGFRHRDPGLDRRVRPTRSSLNCRRGNDHPYQLPWLIVVVVGAVISFLLSGRDIRLLAKILLAIEGIGILSMIVLVVVIFAKGGCPDDRGRFQRVLVRRRVRLGRTERRRRGLPLMGRFRGVARRWARKPTILAATSRGRWPEH